MQDQYLESVKAVELKVQKLLEESGQSVKGVILIAESLLIKTAITLFNEGYSPDSIEELLTSPIRKYITENFGDPLP